MATDYVIVEGDQIQFMPTFGAATVVVQPGVMGGSGLQTLNGSKICLEGDEKDVSVPGCTYMTPTHSIPGVGTIKVDSLAGDQLSEITTDSNKAIIIKGSQLTAKFEVQSPAQQPTPSGPVPDATPSYSGQGMFITSNTLYQVS